MERNIIFVGGINGAGKTTIAGEVSNITSIPFIEGSQNLMKTLGLAKDDYEKLRALPRIIKREGQVESYKEINSTYEQALVTSHFITIINGETHESIGEWFLYCKALMYVYADPEEIFRRVYADKDKRDRKLFPKSAVSDADKVEFLRFTQERSLDAARDVEKEYNIPLTVVTNKDISKAVDFFVESLKTYKYHL